MVKQGKWKIPIINMSLTKLLLLCSKYTLHCLLCRNGAGPYHECKPFSFVSWHKVKICQCKARRAYLEEMASLPASCDLFAGSWGRAQQHTVTGYESGLQPHTRGSQQHTAPPRGQLPQHTRVWLSSTPSLQVFSQQALQGNTFLGMSFCTVDDFLGSVWQVALQALQHRPMLMAFSGTPEGGFLVSSVGTTSLPSGGSRPHPFQHRLDIS